MTQRSILTILGVAAALLLPTGCAQHYNGSLGLAAHHQAKRHGQPADAVAAPAASDPASPASARDIPGGSVIPAAQAPAAQPTYTSNMAGRSTGPLGLYGQLQVQMSGRMSPLDGSGDITRITFTVEGADFDPDVDPDGSHIIYASTRHRTTSDLYIKPVDGTAITQLTADPANEVMPAFSPDGQKVAFASDRAGNWDIYLMDARGGQPMQLTNDLTHDIHPSFSPDGQRLVYCSYGAASGQWEMIIIDVENPTTRRVIGLGLFPTWSPVDDRIVFQRARQRGTRWFSIWTVELRGEDVSPPTEIAVSANAAIITPAWSPDGKRVVFCTVIDPAADEHTRPTQADVWVVGVDGSDRTKLTQGEFANLQPVWSTTNAIYFVSNRGMQGVENIWAMRPAQELEMAGPIRQPIDTAALAPQ